MRVPVHRVVPPWHSSAFCSLVKEFSQLCTVRTREATVLLVLSKETFDRYPKPSHFAPMRQLLQRVAQKDVVSMLKSVPFFSHLSPRDLNLLASLFNVLQFDRGDIVCREGETGSTFYFIVDGSFQVVAEGTCHGFALLAHVRAPCTTFYGCGCDRRLTLPVRELRGLSCREEAQDWPPQEMVRVCVFVCVRVYLCVISVVIAAIACRYCVLRNDELSMFEAEPGRKYSSTVLLSEDTDDVRRRSLATAATITSFRKSKNLSGTAAKQVAVIGGVTCSGSKVLQHSVKIESVEDLNKGNGDFDIHTTDGTCWHMQAAAHHDKVEWIRTINAGMERARSNVAAGVRSSSAASVGAEFSPPVAREPSKPEGARLCECDVPTPPSLVCAPDCSILSRCEELVRHGAACRQLLWRNRARC